MLAWLLGYVMGRRRLLATLVRLLDVPDYDVDAWEAVAVYVRHRAGQKLDAYDQELLASAERFLATGEWKR